MKFPKDEDGQVLNMLYKQGIDFNKKTYSRFLYCNS